MISLKQNNRKQNKTNKVKLNEKRMFVKRIDFKGNLLQHKFEKSVIWLMNIISFILFLCSVYLLYVLMYGKLFDSFSNRAILKKNQLDYHR